MGLRGGGPAVVGARRGGGRPHAGALARRLRVALRSLTGGPSERAQEGNTPLHLAAAMGFAPCVQLLLERGASVDAVGVVSAVPKAGLHVLRTEPHAALPIRAQAGFTPLHSAAADGPAPGKLECARLLLAAGADPCARAQARHTRLRHCGGSAQPERRYPTSVAEALLCPRRRGG